MRKFFFLTGFLVTWGLSAIGQNLLSINPGASGGSYGGVKSVNDGVLAMYGNEAGIASLEGFEAYASAERRFGSQALNFFSIVGAIPTKLGSFGGTIQYHGFENYNEQLIGVAYARKIFNLLALGAQFDLLQVHIPGYGRTSSATAEFGLQARITSAVLLGVHIYNPFEIEWLDGEKWPVVFDMGISYSPTDKLMIVGELEKVSDLEENIKFGLQYEIVEAFALRVGFNTNPSIVTFGVGYRLSTGWSFDVGSTAHRELGLSPMGGVGYKRNPGQ